jgi:hypothetical protein
MHLPVDCAGQHEEGCASVAFAGRRRTLAYVMHDAVRHENIAVLDNPIGENDGPAKDFVRHESNSRSTDFL